MYAAKPDHVPHLTLARAERFLFAMMKGDANRGGVLQETVRQIAWEITG